MNLSFSFGMCSTPNLSKYVALSPLTYKASSKLLLIYTHQDLLQMLDPLF